MRVVVMGDLHYPLLDQADPSLKNARDEFFSTVLEKCLSIDAVAHVCVGDLVQDGAPEEFGYVYGFVNNGGYNRNFFSVFGNHDVRLLRKEDIVALRGQERYGCFDTEEARLLFLDGSTELDGHENRGLIDSNQLEWLDERVSTAGNKTLLLFCHYPVPETTMRSLPEHSIWGIDFRAILNKHKGHGFFFNGHVHYNSIVRENNWHFIQTTCVYDWNAFRIIDINEDEISIDYILLEDEHLKQLGQSVQESIKLPVRPYSIGEESDRRLLLNTKIILGGTK